ncbi:MAG: hypothetical protein K8T20_17470 [Planctomycetes bacterium]|nr:hypothetical protein [Planctomycetota bacterium]
MHRFALAALFLTAPLFVSAEAAPEPVEMKLKLAKGQSWKVEQTLEMTGTGGDISGTPGKHMPFVKGAWVLKESWTDTVDVDADGRPLTVKRLVAASKAGMAGRTAEPTTAEGVTLLIEEKEKEPNSHVSAAKGKMPQAIADVLARGPVDPVSWLLPTAAVKAGDTWKINAQWVCQFERITAASMAGAAHTTDFSAMLQDLRAWGETVNGCEVTAKVASVDKNEAVIELQGESGMGTAKTVVTGKLRWSVPKGRPVQLDWTRTRTVMANEETRSKGYTEEWKLVKSWK